MIVATPTELDSRPHPPETRGAGGVLARLRRVFAGFSEVRWTELLAVGAGAGLVYLASEWLFFASKPSFMSVLSWPARLGLLVRLGLAAAALGALGVAVPATLAVALRRLPGHGLWATVGRLVPAALLAVTGLLLVDNFTITVLGFGVPSSRGPVRIAYLLSVLALTAYFLGRVRAWERACSQASRPARGLVAGALLVGLVWPLATRATSGVGFSGGAGSSDRTSRPASVLLVGPDGINSDRLSVYGATRETTPFLKELAKTSLVVEHARTNCAHTTGSLVSILTGKLPTTTRVIFPPDILRGRDAYQHLPGILRSRGYFCIDLSVRSYADPIDLNMRDSFHYAGDRLIQEGGLTVEASRWLGEPGGYLLGAMASRVADRLGHVFMVRQMADPYARVSSTRKENGRDVERVAELMGLLAKVDKPYFAHVHFLDSHGPRFDPARRVFSAGIDQTADYMPEYLDDAILNFDDRLRDLLGQLATRSRRDDTIVVVYSDHGPGYRTDQEVPLIIHFPGGAHAGRFDGDAQNLDIAPTILDALGVLIPGWMEGESLLKATPTHDRWTVAARASSDVTQDEGGSLRVKYRVPFFSLSAVELTACDARFVLNVQSSLLTGPMALPLTTGGGGCTAPSRKEVRDYLLRCLAAGGYDVTSLDHAAGPGSALAGGEKGSSGTPLTRAEAARMIARVFLGSIPAPNATGRVFKDVGADTELAPWIELLGRVGLIYPDAGGTIRPDEPFLRSDAAIVLLRLRHGPVYAPPQAREHRFADVPPYLAPWVEQLESDLGKMGCGAGAFCPTRAVTRTELARLLALAVRN